MARLYACADEDATRESQPGGHDVFLAVSERFGKGQPGPPDAGWVEENERTDGALRGLEARAGADDGVSDGIPEIGDGDLGLAGRWLRAAQTAPGTRLQKARPGTADLRAWMAMTAAGRKLYVPWKRFWCRFGDEVHVGADGFLTDPDDAFTRLYNPRLCTLDQLLSEPCLVLCGDPGLGKTTELQQARPLVESKVQEGDHLIWLEFRDIPNEQVFARRTFDSPAWQAWRGSTGRLVLVVDEVDEGRIKIPDFVSYLTGQLRTESVERLQIVLACRSADWPVAAGSEVVALWGAKAKAPIFELCPLRQDDAELAAQTKGLDLRSFVEAVFQPIFTGISSLFCFSITKSHLLQD